MSDVKEYWPCAGEIADGNIKISEDVLASIATIAVTETEGVAAAASTVGGGDHRDVQRPQGQYASGRQDPF